MRVAMPGVTEHKEWVGVPAAVAQTAPWEVRYLSAVDYERQAAYDWVSGRLVRRPIRTMDTGWLAGSDTALAERLLLNLCDDMAAHAAHVSVLWVSALRIVRFSDRRVAGLEVTIDRGEHLGLAECDFALGGPLSDPASRNTNGGQNEWGTNG